MNPCEFCTLPLGVDHDAELGLCKSIELAFHLEAKGVGNKLSRLITDTVARIRAHRDPATRAAYRKFLDHYVEIFRKEEPRGI
jgi:hypothetical protein